MMDKVEAVAMDGPAGAGKSTVARRVAEALDYLYVDTGAMYRTVTLAAMRRKVPFDNPEALGHLSEELQISFDRSGTKVFLNGEDVSVEIRSPELTRNIRFAASSPQVRTELVRQQQEISRQRPVVMEGRDITTIVLPDARWPFYLDASVECRAERRRKELEGRGEKVTLALLQQEIEARDRSDFERTVGPLRRTAQQIYLDTSRMSQEEVVIAIVQRVKYGHRD